MAERDFPFEQLEHFLEKARTLAGIKADACYPNDCIEKQKYIERKFLEIYKAKVGERY